jgi:hypothetical protein
MKRPLSIWLLVITLAVLALGGLSGAWGFLSDPSGKGMGMSDQLGQLPIHDYTLPGILLLAMFIFPLVLIYGLLARPQWRFLDLLLAWTGGHWPWAGSLGLGIALAIWLAIQAAYIGFAAPIQWFTAFLDFSILLTTLVSSTRKYYQKE